MRRIKLMAGEIEVPVYNPEQRAWVLRIFQGRVFEVKGERLEIFRLSVLARCIDYSRQHLVLWERQKLFPTPVFCLPFAPHGSSKRWYSKVQIANIRAQYLKYLRLHQQGTPFQVKNFLRDVKAVFYLRHLLPDAVNGEVR